MKKIGLIGGLSWESSLVYYQLMNERVKAKLGGFHSCKCLLESLDFAEVEKLQHQGNWEALHQLMAASAKNLVQAGAEVVILCTNTMHLSAESIREAVSIPFLHIAEVTGKAIQAQKLQKVLLLGTKFTMEKDFYKGILQNQFGIEVLIPSEADRKIIHQVIYKELVQGIIREASKEQYQTIIQKAADNGAEGVVLGCTEIPLLIKPEDVAIPIFDTTKIHAHAAVDFAIGKG